MSNFWSAYVIFFTILTSFGSIWLLLKVRKSDSDTLEGETLGHEFDGIQELNNPLPRWWLILYLGTFVFGIGYLILYPGFGNFPGVLNWTSESQMEQEAKTAQAKYGEMYTELANKPIEALLENEKALQMGQRIFLANCIACHGSDGAGSKGFPDLTDDDWLYGNSPEQVKQSIVQGRSGMMPPMGAALGEQGVKELVAFIQSLEDSDSDDQEEEEVEGEKEHSDERDEHAEQGEDEMMIAQGKQKFATFCAACHGENAQGNIFMGAPNLTDNVWLFGGSDEDIQKTIVEGRSGKMPAHAALIDAEKIHILTAYVLSLSKE